MKRILLTKEKSTIVDDEDYEYLNQWKWCFSGVYAQRRISKTKSIYLHRLLMNFPLKKEIDHINGDPLDNRKINLRIATHAQNMKNIKVKKNSYKGITYMYKYYKGKKSIRLKPWVAQISIEGKNNYLGHFYTKEEAAKAYNEAAEKYFGDYARLNKL